MVRPDSRVFRLVTVGLSVLVTLAAVELILRVEVGSSNADLFVYRSDTLRLKLMRPNVQAVVYGQPIETNGSGFRARREYSSEKPSGVRRIVVIGDSFTVCAGVPVEKIATTRLEAMLNGTYAPLRFEVYNLGVGGHEILHHLGTLKEVALSYKPDLVLLFLFPYNDFDTSTYELHRQRADVVARGGSLPEASGQAVPLLESLHLVKIFRMSGSTLLGLAGGIPSVQRLLGPSSHDRLVSFLARPSPDRERSIEALREMRGVLRDASVPVQVYLLPANDASYAMQRPLYNEASRIVEEAGFEALSLLDAFVLAGRAPRTYRVSLIDSHPDAEYGAVAARAIFEHLLRGGAIGRLVAPGPGPGDRLPAASDGVVSPPDVLRPGS